ncbi:MAG: hypothetical protein IT266_11980 [Saprospiraceae bacterium]|nr:hypothetical protein [Saprospiraceae bacterium]
MRYLLFIAICLTGLSTQVWAHKPSEQNLRKDQQEKKLQTRGGACAPATKQIDLDINNVRARLLNGGDCWWDLNRGSYIVPKVVPGSNRKEVSAIFAGAVWVGGYDPARNLHMMGQTFRSSSSNDCWPGPLTNLGETDMDICLKWDQFFVVNGSSIREQQKNFRAVRGIRDLTLDEIPEDVLYYPARGNKFFSQKYNFELPDPVLYPQGLGLFYEYPESEDGIYQPEKGEFPIIDIRGCPQPVFPDQMIFWIYNDNGGIHTNSNGEPIRMEVQVQAFAFTTSDEINDMTFQRYKLINRAPQDLVDCYFAMWVDPDLGCYSDDYIGCNIDRSLMYIYNIDATDGNNGCNCDRGVNTYCTEIPVLGVDYFRGPLDTAGREIGMSSFMYYNNPSGGGNHPAATTDPGTAIEYYRYLTGRWRDGTPLTNGGTGYNPGSADSTRYAFSGEPDDPSSWSMCSVQAPEGDRRTMQATGPMLLKPGAINELIIGAVFVPDQNYPCPNLDELYAADNLAQDLFDQCFELKDGPSAPDVDFVELDQELVMVLTNDIGSNNYQESYAGKGIGLPPGVDSLYRFEGYRIFQVADASITLSEAIINDPTKVREIFTVDLKNKISRVYNWVGIKNPNPNQTTHPIVYTPVEKVAGPNLGIRHTFSITEDQFAKGDRRLINHKKYYFVVLAYGYNNFQDYDLVDNVGQRTQYCPGRLNIGPNGDGKPYTAIPRPAVYEHLNSGYGAGVEITRHDGVGAGNTDLLVRPDMYEKMLNPGFDGKVTYVSGRGPVEIKVYDPLRVKDGNYELLFTDANINNTKLDDPVNWLLIRKNSNDTVRSENDLSKFTEQVMNKFGLSIAIGQTIEAGSDSLNTCGVIGEGLYYDYKDPGGEKWLIGQPDNNAGQSDFILTSLGQSRYSLDPKECFSKLGDGEIEGTWYPYKLPSDTNFLTPVWIDPLSKVTQGTMKMSDLNNVDIVFTSDKSKWSRCLVVETWNSNAGIELASPVSGVKNFAIKRSPSVTKDDNNNDGLPDIDTNEDSTGYAWFPGYAVDVESGKRLNILFGENSFYSQDNPLMSGCSEHPDGFTGNDMMYNPTDEYVILNQACPINIFNSDLGVPLGGHHYIYVTKTPYDSCKSFRLGLNSTKIADKNRLFRDFTWCTMSAAYPGARMKSYAEGLIPNDLTVRLRVDNAYQHAIGTNENKGHNFYSFTVSGYEAGLVVDQDDFENALDNVNVVPNPYYGFSNYETGQFSNVVKITNLPASCVVTIYSIDGKFIKQYKRDEVPVKRIGSNPGITERQILPDLEWDLTNFKNIPVSSGAYIIHIKENGTGVEKIVKWFGVARKFDPSGL